MDNLVGNGVGLIHLVTALLATGFGTAILIMKKGTKVHVRVGYAYVSSMVMMLATSFMLYRLFGHFGIFHFSSIASSLTLLGGMIPVIFKIPKKSWLDFHLGLMYWSVIGLYAAFASEVFTRIPNTPFFAMVGIATFVIIAAGGFFFKRYKGSWEQIQARQ